MKNLLCFALLFAVVTLFANAGVFRGSGQTVVLDSTAQIQMAEEVVTMAPMRGNYPVDSSCRNLDPMKFHCVFKLRNLTDRTVTVPVGFPIATEALWFRDKTKINQTEVIAYFSFIAGTKERTFPVRYVPFDKKKKFSNIFLWEMTFQPKQEIELFVCYIMPGYLGLATTQKGDRPWENIFKLKHRYLENLEFAAGQGQMYVTETGKSWAGKIEKAVFRIVPFDFEEYLTKRGAFENQREENNPRKDIKIDLLKTAPMTRKWIPEYQQWKLVKDKQNRNLYLELVYTPFEPKSKADNLQFFYVFPCIPVTKEQFDSLLAFVRKNMEKEYARREEMLKFWENAKKRKTHPAGQIKDVVAYWQRVGPYTPAVERNLADAVLEFYGIRRNNPEIRDFLERQCWYPAEPRPIDPALKKHLLKAAAKAEAMIKKAVPLQLAKAAKLEDFIQYKGRAYLSPLLAMEQLSPCRQCKSCKAELSSLQKNLILKIQEFNQGISGILPILSSCRNLLNFYSRHSPNPEFKAAVQRRQTEINADISYQKKLLHEAGIQ